MHLVKFAQLRVELRSVFGRWVLIVFAEMALKRTVDFSAALEWRWEIATPGAKRVARVVGDRRLEHRIGRRHEIDDPSTHAKPNDAETISVDRRVVLQEADTSVYIIDNSPVGETRPAG